MIYAFGFAFKTGCDKELGWWAERERGEVEGFPFLTFSNLNTSNCFQNFPKTFKNF
jgi:hypothetical protein